ncbi:DUF3106 domain-containing protein [Roseateles sp. DAIF2]|uniref:DUF3106 domain-containing protein n=1 Tax=Roseateles sp. DAIF2 TaxID=2714952 RepID=UPI0018A32698|nr:DUF3106 domain-containing protein [Roseateles sp. DAIF2]QPF74956.1 DUF3106 domain-containing protein [Roseateles sp. DAIF2]
MTRADPHPSRTLAQPIACAVWLAVALCAGPALAQTTSADPAASAPTAPIDAVAPAASAAPLPVAAPAPLTPLPALPATTPSTTIEWQALSPAHKQLLAPLEKEWNALDPSRRGKWLELAARYPQLPEHEQQRVQQRMSDWAKLSPAERQQARIAFQASRQLKADERQAKWEAYQALPEEKRQQLADKAAQKARPVSVAAPASSSKAPPAPKPALVPLRPVVSAEQPLGPTVLQAKPGATTVLINQGRAQARQPTGNPRLALDMGRLDDKTLLPKAIIQPARQ